MQFSGQSKGTFCGVVYDSDDRAVLLIVTEVLDDGLQQGGLLCQDGTGSGQWKLLWQFQSVGDGACHHGKVSAGI
jgi:hypothetical protein